MKLELQQIDVNYTIPTINFPSSSELLAQAKNLSDHLQTVVVTEDTISTNKKLVAKVRKRADELNSRRIKIKKEILKPYEMFKSDVDEIINEVKSGEDIIRNQIQEFENQQRDEKQEAITELFEKRIEKYPLIKDLGISVMDFIKPSHLNKSASLDKTEVEMVNWLEKVERELKILKDMDHGLEMIAEYKTYFDMSQAMEIVQERYTTVQSLEKACEGGDKAQSQKTFTISLTDELGYYKLLEYARSEGIEVVAK